MGFKVLIVEADDHLRRNISQRLLLENYKVFETSEESQAHKIVRKRDVDVVLLGLGLMKKRGLALLKAIKIAHPFTEVILMTPADHLSLAIEGMKLGAFDDLLMPFDVETLLDRVREACSLGEEKRKGRKRLPRHHRMNLSEGSKKDVQEQEIALEIVEIKEQDHPPDETDP